MMTVPTTSEETSTNSQNQEHFQANVELLKAILGDDISHENIRHALRGAGGNPDIALNHLLNDAESARSMSDSPTDGNNLTPLEKVLCDLAEEVKCPLCLGYFRQPLILGCFHTFCSPCLEELISEEHQIQCPLCRMTVDVSERGLSGLKHNHYLANIVDKLKAAQSTKMCAECQKSICTVFCRQCKSFLCNDCNDKIHTMRVLINHHRVPFEDMFFDTPTHTEITSPRNPQLSTSPQKTLLSSSPNSLLELSNRRNSSSFSSPYNVVIPFQQLDCVIPFNVKKEVCMDLFSVWIRDLWFAPSDLLRKAVVLDFQALYIPYWLFEVEVISQYNCMVGYSDTVVSSALPTNRNRSSSGGSTFGLLSLTSRLSKPNETANTPANMRFSSSSGTASNKFSSVVVCASKSSEASLISEFEPWKLEQIQSFTLKHVEGVDVQAFDLDSDKAWQSLAKNKLEELNKELCEKKVKSSLISSSSETVSNMTIDSSYIIHKSRRLFVPIYATTYEYQGATYRFLVNGSTAKVIGQRPYSTSKLASLSVTGIGAAIGIISSRLHS